MTSPLVAGAGGSMGNALETLAIMAKTKAVVISLFMKSLPICSRPSSAAGERDAGADLADRLIDQLHRAFAVAALVGRRGAKFSVGRLQQADAGGHMRLRADGVADAHAGGDRGPEQRLAGEGCRHLLVSSEVFNRLRNAAASGGRCRRTVKLGRRPCLGLEGARRLPIWTVRRCFLQKGVLLGWRAFSRRSSGRGQTWTARHQNSPPMPVLKKMLSTDMLPQGLSERQ